MTGIVAATRSAARTINPPTIEAMNRSKSWKTDLFFGFLACRILSKVCEIDLNRQNDVTTSKMIPTTSRPVLRASISLKTSLNTSADLGMNVSKIKLRNTSLIFTTVIFGVNRNITIIKGMNAKKVMYDRPVARKNA